jgi:hypothetical protein
MGVMFRTFRWQSTRGERREFELKLDGVKSGGLTWPSEASTYAQARFGENLWVFCREGFLNPWISVREMGASADLATLSPDWRGGGLVQFAGGAHFEVVPGNYWEPDWRILDDLGETVIRFGPADEASTTGFASLVVGVALPEPTLLVLLGWYLLVMHALDTRAPAFRGRNV